MSSTPVVPAPVATTHASEVMKILSFVMMHIILVAVLVFGGIYFIDSQIAKRDAASDSKWAAIVSQQNDVVKDIKQRLDADQAQRAIRDAAEQATISKLTQAISDRDKQTAAQVKVDATLSASDVSRRLSDQIGAAPGDITAVGDSVSASLPAARKIVGNLDSFASAQQNLSDTKAQLNSETSIALDAQSNVDGQKKLIISMQQSEADAKNKCDADIKLLKAQNRKRNLKYMLFGGAVVEGIRIYLTGHP